MNKRLLISFAAIMGAMTSFAYNVGDYVYTHDAKFKVVRTLSLMVTLLPIMTVGKIMPTEFLVQTIGLSRLVLLRMAKVMLSRVLMVVQTLLVTICIRLFLLSRVRLMLLHLR